ncbi:aspartate ammonia-lyase [Arthrobacter oryzae]|nr:aspartate ammonia-lyase [Arthrobacter oryzae]
MIATSRGDAYSGVHTLRAVENFPIAGQQLSSNMHLVRSSAAVKLGAARSDRELGRRTRTFWTADWPTSSS